MKGYKSFDKNWSCNGFSFEIGKEYEHLGEIKLCKSGFHFCENPLDILNYNDLCEGKFAEIEADEVDEEKSNDSKRVAKKIKINTQLDFIGFY